MDRMLREDDVAKLTGLSRTTRYKLERRGEFVPRVRLVGRNVGWWESEIIDWLKKRDRVSTSDAGMDDPSQTSTQTIVDKG